MHSEEGLRAMEMMAQEKMAERLVKELEKALHLGNENGGFQVHKVFSDDLFGGGSGDLFGRQCKKETFWDVVNKVILTGMARESRRKAEEARREREVETPLRRWEEAILENSKKAGEEEEEKEALELDRRVRSDAIEPEDMVEEDLFQKLGQLKNKEAFKEFASSSEFKRELEKSLEEIVRETERETGAKLSQDQKEPLLEQTAR